MNEQLLPKIGNIYFAAFFFFLISNPLKIWRTYNGVEDFLIQPEERDNNCYKKRKQTLSLMRYIRLNMYSWKDYTELNSFQWKNHIVNSINFSLSSLFLWTHRNQSLFNLFQYYLNSLITQSAQFTVQDTENSVYNCFSLRGTVSLGVTSQTVNWTMLVIIRFRVVW